MVDGWSTYVLSSLGRAAADMVEVEKTVGSVEPEQKLIV